jgi:L,D-peptidoglycan transpeptidase YkuD (ErfK/YbiS/YcfS/YnhG family)
MRIPRVALIWACLAGLMTSAGACQSSVTPSAAPATTTTTTQSPSASLTVANPTPSAAPTTKRPTPHPSATVTARRPAPAPKPAAPKPAPPKPAAPKPAPPKPAPPTPPGCAVPWGLTARQVVLVDAHGSGATVRACERSGSRYLQVLGPYAGHVGTKGVSWSKVEGDMHTPAGVFPLRNGFGVNRNPGLGAGSWLRVDASDVWVDDPESAFYNTHQRLPVDGRWDSAERLQLSPAYNYVQVIGYNEARTPYRGSAIFLHVDQGRGTAGCVSLPTAALLSVMRWERVGAVIAITP